MLTHEKTKAFAPTSLAPEFSVVMCSIDERKFQTACSSYRRRFADVSIEIIGVHDALSLSEGYNRGIALASGRYLILSHDDIELVTPDIRARILGHLAKFDLIGVAGTTRVIGGAWFLAGYPYVYHLIIAPIDTPGQHAVMITGDGGLVRPHVQGLDGVFMAMRMEVARAIRFDEDTFNHFHLYDIDFSYRAYKHGYALGICRDLVIFHQSHGNYGEDWKRECRKFEQKFAGQLESVPQRVPIPMTRARFDMAALKDDDNARWLCTRESLMHLVSKVEAPIVKP